MTLDGIRIQQRADVTRRCRASHRSAAARLVAAEHDPWARRTGPRSRGSDPAPWVGVRRRGRDGISEAGSMTEDRASARACVEELYAAHHAEIYGYLCRMVRDDELAADLAQETFVKAFRAYRHAGRPRSGARLAVPDRRPHRARRAAPPHASSASCRGRASRGTWTPPRRTWRSATASLATSSARSA